MKGFEILNGTIFSRRQGLLTTASGWLLLIAGLAILRLDALPTQLKSFDDWLRPFVARLYVDAPMPPGVWLPGILLLLMGMTFVGYAGTNLLDALHLSFPNFRTRTAMPSHSLTPPWLVLVLASNLIWMGVVIGAARTMGPTHWSIIPLWLIAIVLQGACWWRTGHSKQVNLRVSFRWVPIAGIAVAVGIVTYRLGDVPSSIWGDEGAFWGVARDLATGTRANPFAWGVYGAYPLLSSFYQSFWLRIFGSTLWSWRFSSAVIGVLTIVPLFHLVRRLLGVRVAWSAVVLMIGTPYFLAFTRMGYNNIQSLFPVTMGLWLIVEALFSQSRGLAYVAGVAFGMASLTYTAGHVGLLLAVLFLLFLCLSTKVKPSRRSLMELGFCMGIGWLYAAGPCFLGAALRGDLLGGKGAESFFGSAFYGEALFPTEELTRLYPLQRVGQHMIFFEPGLYILLLARGVIRTGLGMVVDGIAVQHYLVGPLAGPGVVFFLAGFAWVLRWFRQHQAIFWAIWILVCILLLSMLNTFPPRATHLVPIIPAVATLTAVGVWLLNGLLRGMLRPLWADSVAVVLTIVLALIGLDAYFVRMPEQYMPDLQNLMFWRAQEMVEGSRVVFIADAPYPSDLQVRDIDEFRLGVDYQTVPADRVRTTNFRALCGDPDTQPGATCRVFFLAGAKADSTKTELWRQLGEGTIRTHTDARGRTIGLEFVPENSVVDPGTGPWRSGLLWNGALVSGVLTAIVLSPLPIQVTVAKLILQVSVGIIAVKRRIASMRVRWAHRIGPALFLGCVICGILGQVYLTWDILPDRTGLGMNFWPGAIFYGFSIVYLLQLTETATSALRERVSSLPNLSQPVYQVWGRDRKDRIVKWWRSYASELAIVLIMMSVAFALRVFAGQATGSQSVNGPLIGTASVLATYGLARELLGRRAAIVSGFFLAAQHYHLHFSRLGSSGALDTLSAPLLVFLLLRGFRSHRRGWFVAAAALTLGLALYSCWGAIVLPILMLVVAAMAGGPLLVRRTLSQANVVNLGILVLGAAFALVSMAFAEIGLSDGYLGQLSQSTVFRFGNSLLRSSLAFNYFVDTSSWYWPSIPMLDPVSGVLFVMGLTVAVRSVLKNVGYLLLVAWMGVAVVVSSLLTVSPVVSESLAITTPALALIIALGLVLLAEYGMVLGKYFALMSRHLPFVVTIVLILVNVSHYFGGIYPPNTQLFWRHPQISISALTSGWAQIVRL